MVTSTNSSVVMLPPTMHPKTAHCAWHSLSGLCLLSQQYTLYMIVCNTRSLSEGQPVVHPRFGQYFVVSVTLLLGTLHCRGRICAGLVAADRADDPFVECLRQGCLSSSDMSIARCLVE